MDPDFLKYIQIGLILSPLFLSVLLVALILNRGINKLQRHALYWLTGFILIMIALVYGVLTNNISTYSLLIAFPALGLYWEKYLKKRK